MCLYNVLSANGSFDASFNRGTNLWGTPAGQHRAAYKLFPFSERGFGPDTVRMRFSQKRVCVCTAPTSGTREGKCGWWLAVCAESEHAPSASRFRAPGLNCAAAPEKETAHRPVVSERRVVRSEMRKSAKTGEQSPMTPSRQASDLSRSHPHA